MAFNNTVNQMTTTTTNHADNFNVIHGQLLDNDKYLKVEVEKNDVDIANLQSGKVDKNTYNIDKSNQSIKDSQQDTEISNLKTTKLTSATFNTYRTEQAAKDLAQDQALETEATNRQNADTILHESVDKKIVLNGEVGKSSFDFIENKVVQDGLFVNEKQSRNVSRKYNLRQSIIDVSCSISSQNWRSGSTDGTYYIIRNASSFMVHLTNNIVTLNYITTSGTTKNLTTSVNKQQYNVRVLVISNKIQIYFDNVLIFNISDFTGVVIADGIVFGHSHIAGHVTGSCYMTSLLVYSKELTQHEIQHNFSVLNNSPSINQLQVISPTNQVSTLAIGSDGDHVEMRTNRTLEEEYVGVLEGMAQEYTSAGETITVNDALNARLVGAEIQGQTVKNYCNYLQSITLSKTLVVSTINTITLDTTKQYSFLIDVTRIVGTPIIQLTDVGGVGIVNSRITAKIGLNKVVFTPTVTQVNKVGMATTASADAECDFRIVGVFDGDVNVSSQLPFGLSSTVATISNNGISYPLYASLEDKAAKKPILLGKVDTVSDKLTMNSDGSLSEVDSTKVITLQATTTTLTDYKSGTPIIASGTATIAGNVITGTVGEVVRYQLATPTTTTIPKEVNAPILTNQSNILSVDSQVAPSSFSVKIPTTSQIKRQYTQTLLNGYTGTASANLLKDGRVQIDMTVTIPSTFNQTVFSLPVELRPKVARKLIGFNGNNPVTLLVGTDGTVRIPTTITGVVELNGMYNL